MTRAAIVALAVVAALAPIPPPLVERFYSTSAYLLVQPPVTRASNATMAAWFDLLVAAVLVYWLAGAVFDLRFGVIRAVVRIVIRTVVVVAAAYVAFLAMWGLNYRRVPLVDKLRFDAARVNPGAARELAVRATIELNRLYAPAHAAGWTTIEVVDPPLAAAFARAQADLGGGRVAVAARPKRTLLQPYFARAGVSGMTDPYFLESLVDDTLLPFERSFVVAHEWAHLAGYADEGEANFVGWLTCQRGRDADRYSAWLFMYDELLNVVPRGERGTLAQALDAGVARDLQAIAERLRRNINPTIAMAGWRAYDSYLKANRVEEGTASYDAVVRLVLGTAFDDDWRPQLK